MLWDCKQQLWITFHLLCVPQKLSTVMSTGKPSCRACALGTRWVSGLWFSSCSCSVWLSPSCLGSRAQCPKACWAYTWDTNGAQVSCYEGRGHKGVELSQPFLSHFYIQTPSPNHCTRNLFYLPSTCHSWTQALSFGAFLNPGPIRSLAPSPTFKAPLLVSEVTPAP